MVLVYLHVHAAIPCRCVCVCVCGSERVSEYKCRNTGCPASDQCGTGMKKTNYAGPTGLVPDQADEVRHFFAKLSVRNVQRVHLAKIRRFY
jgi:hypothetical protein